MKPKIIQRKPNNKILSHTQILKNKPTIPSKQLQ